MDFLTVLVKSEWPAITGCIVWVFRKPITDLIGRMQPDTIDFLGVKTKWKSTLHEAAELIGKPIDISPTPSEKTAASEISVDSKSLQPESTVDNNSSISLKTKEEIKNYVSNYKFDDINRDPIDILLVSYHKLASSIEDFLMSNLGTYAPSPSFAISTGLSAFDLQPSDRKIIEDLVSLRKTISDNPNIKISIGEASLYESLVNEMIPRIGKAGRNPLIFGKTNSG